MIKPLGFGERNRKLIFKSKEIDEETTQYNYFNTS